MKADLLSHDLLRLVKPLDARSYARAKGWQRVSGVNGEIALFARPGSPDEQLIVPMNETFMDYPKRIRELVENLAEFESRPAAEVLQELLVGDADLVRYGHASASAARGTLPLPDAVRLLEGARKSLLAAACSVLEPVAYHARMNQGDAQQLLRACQFGQTERSSFSISILCPLRAIERDRVLEPGAQTFARKSTTFLMRSVAALVKSIESDEAPGTSLDLHGAPPLSSNLCEALLQMQPAEERSQLVLSVAWSPTLPPLQGVPTSIRVKDVYFPFIEEVYERIRGVRQSRDSLFVGYVDSLKGQPGADGRVQGEATLSVFHDEEVRKARIDLGADDYQVAIDAHRTARAVKFKGVLHPGRRLDRITDVLEFVGLE